MHVSLRQCSFHPPADGAVHSRYRKGIVVRGESGIALNRVQYPHDGFGCNQIVPAKSAAVVNHKSIARDAPGEKLRRDNLPRAVRGAEPSALQAYGLEQDLRDLILRRL